MSSIDTQLLIVEDDFALQKQHRSSLDRFVDVAASDRARVMEQVRRHRSPMTTMDLGLPPDRHSVSVGFRLLEELLGAEPATKVITLTGRNDCANAPRAVAQGADGYIATPFEPQLVGLTIECSGGLQEVAVDIWMVGGIHQDPTALVARGRLREPLYY